jgi:hypothetical protein
MGISLNPETERLIQEKMKAGGYASADEFLQSVLGNQLDLEIAPLDEETLDAIDEAERQIARGEARDWAVVREELKAKYLGK